MKIKTFLGGIFPPHKKSNTEKKCIEVLKDPDRVFIPIIQHIGRESNIIVKKGDSVKIGQKVAEASAFVSSNIHSSISGIVKNIEPLKLQDGKKVVCIEIENDFSNTVDGNIVPYPKLDNMTKQDILKMIEDAGIVGLGGATFPTHVKLSPPEDKKIDVLILNAAECEPYLTSDHRLMIEYTKDIFDGIKIISKILNNTITYIGIEDNKLDCIEILSEYIKINNIDDIKIVKCKTKYPQGSEKQLIYSCTNRVVPSGKLPADVGVIVINVATAKQIAVTHKTGMPLIDRICTVSGGAVNEPKNLLVKIGTLYSDFIDICKVDTEDTVKIISGGPMMGKSQSHFDIPVAKGTSGVLFLTEDEISKKEASSCIRCAKCIDACPVRIQPMYISAFSYKMNYDKAEEFNAMDCIECGACSFVCPAKIDLVHSIKVAKNQILKKRRKLGV